MHFPNIARKLLFALAAAGLLAAALQASDLDVGGFLSNGYLKSSRYNYLADSEKGSGEFAEIGLNASWTPMRRTTVNGQLFAFELGDYGDFKLAIDYLFVDRNFRREFGLRAGRIKRELGVYTHVQDIDVSRATILLPMGMYDPRYRYNSAALNGVSAYGDISLWENAYLDYTVYGGHVNVNKDGGLAAYAISSISDKVSGIALESAESEYTYGGQIWFSPGVEGLRIGLGISQFVDFDFVAKGTVRSDNPNPFLAGRPLRLEAENLDVRYAQFSVEYFLGEWNFVGEALHVDSTYVFLTQIGNLPTLARPSERSSDSWYLSGARRFGKLEAALTYAEFHADPTDVSGAPLANPNQAYNKDAQFSLRYDVSGFWTLKAEIHDVRGTNRLFNERQQNPELDKSQWTLFAMKSTFSF